MFESALASFSKNLSADLSQTAEEQVITHEANRIQCSHNHDADNLIAFLNFIYTQQSTLSRFSKKADFREYLRTFIQRIIDSYYEGYSKDSPKDPTPGRNRLRKKLEKFAEQLRENVFVFDPPEVPRQKTVEPTPMKEPRKYDKRFDIDAVRGIQVIPRLKQVDEKELTPSAQLDGMLFDEKLTYHIKKFTSQNEHVEYIKTFLEFMKLVMDELQLTPQSPRHFALIEPVTRTHAKITFSGEIPVLLPLGEQFIDGPLKRTGDQPWFSFYQEMEIKLSADRRNWEFIRGDFVVIPCAYRLLAERDPFFQHSFHTLPKVTRFHERRKHAPSQLLVIAVTAEMAEESVATPRTPITFRSAAAGAFDPRLFAAGGEEKKDTLGEADEEDEAGIVARDKEKAIPRRLFG